MVIKGVPVREMDAVEQSAAWLGIASHIGTPVSQNKMGHVLGHVADHGEDPNDPTVRTYRTPQKHRFHTDSCDVVGLLCINSALTGGLSSIASSWSVYREMQVRQPQLLAELEAELYWDRKGEVGEGEKPYYKGAVFNANTRGQLLTIYDRGFFETAHRHGVPPLTTTQTAAMDLFEEIADELKLDMELEPGDIQLLHNHQILHSRTAYTNHATDPTRQRHLMRLWLSFNHDDGVGWELPPSFRDGRYKNTDRSNGVPVGGILSAGPSASVPLGKR